MRVNDRKKSAIDNVVNYILLRVRAVENSGNLM
ncbi:hypothetical protein QE385_000200 [Sphingomonas sp. SORGH_AS 950]|nr:hypothetical protein [Sphingomonas sp. SORGH_AS_0950]